MAENSKIGWCNDTVNFWWGCTKISPACTNCYAADNRFSKGLWGEDALRRRVKDAENLARRLNRKAEREGMRRLVFVNSMSDFFESDNDQQIVDHQNLPIESSLTSLRRLAFKCFDECQHLTFLLLTKRPENIRPMWCRKLDAHPSRQHMQGENAYRSNVWIGTTVENQEYADKRIPELAKLKDLTPVRFLSCEPLLSSLSLSPYLSDFEWCITGCESGGKRRPSETMWFEKSMYQCHDAGIPYFQKQMEVDGKVSTDINLFPDHLQVQQFPEIGETHGV